MFKSYFSKILKKINNINFSKKNKLKSNSKINQFHLNESEKIRKRFQKIWDLKKGMFKTARKNAEKEVIYHDLGRTLPYYAEIHEALSRNAGGIKKLKGKKVLHLAASTGIYTKYLQSLGINAISLDIDKLAVKKATETGTKKIILADAKKLPFKENSIDFFISDHFLLSDYLVLELERGSKKVLTELSRVLKKNGIGIIHSYSPLYFKINRDLIKSNRFELIERIEQTKGDFIDTNNFCLVLRKK
jgi:SAM-dependent methyltransferase